jgi:hypothetical protein
MKGILGDRDKFHTSQLMNFFIIIRSWIESYVTEQALTRQQKWPVDNRAESIA